MNWLKLLGASIAAFSLTACATRQTTDDQVKLINALKDAGCVTTTHIDIGGETGQLGGGAHAGVVIDGKCDPTIKPPSVPIVNP